MQPSAKIADDDATDIAAAAAAAAADMTSGVYDRAVSILTHSSRCTPISRSAKIKYARNREPK